MCNNVSNSCIRSIPFLSIERCFFGVENSQFLPDGNIEYCADIFDTHKCILIDIF